MEYDREATLRALARKIDETERLKSELESSCASVSQVSWRLLYLLLYLDVYLLLYLDCLVPPLVPPLVPRLSWRLLYLLSSTSTLEYTLPRALP